MADDASTWSTPGACPLANRRSERAVRALLDQADRYWWPQPERAVALGCPPWLAHRLAGETGHELKPGPGGGVVTVLDSTIVFGSADLGTPGSGTLVLQDMRSGWRHELPTRCHPDVPPHRWPDFTLALSDGLNPHAAASIARVGTG